MSTSELAAVGLVGSGVGALLGTPLVWPGQPGRVDLRVLGAVLLAGAGLSGLISARLVGIVPGSDIVNHGVNALGLLAFSAAAGYVRLATGLSPLLPRGLVASPAIYAALTVVRAATTGRSDVPFLCLVPLVVAFTVVSAMAVWRDHVVRDALVPPAWVVGFMATVNVAQFVRMGFGDAPAVRAAVPLAMAGGFMSMVTFVAWRAAGRLGTSSSGAGARYERSGLRADAAMELLARVDQAMRKDRLFARSDLTLTLVARTVGATMHQVSEALNRFRGLTFNEYLSRWRLDDVKAQLSEPGSDRYTIEGIGAAAGFGSRSALYAAFRRFEGMTPTAYRANITASAQRAGCAAPRDPRTTSGPSPSPPGQKPVPR